MKIQILKSGNSKVTTYAACPMLVDVPPDGDDARKSTKKQ
jgi:hypothetical protein